MFIIYVNIRSYWDVLFKEVLILVFGWIGVGWGEGDYGVDRGLIEECGWRDKGR